MKVSTKMAELEVELARWRRKLDEARLQVHLGTLHLAEREQRAIERFEPAYDRAREKLAAIGHAADDRASALRSGIEAGWNELRATYQAIRAQQREAQEKTRA